MSKNSIKLTIQGAFDKSAIDLNSFLKQLNALRETLFNTDKIANNKRTFRYEITGLSMNSPATIELESVIGEQPNSVADLLDPIPITMDLLYDIIYKKPMKAANEKFHVALAPFAKILKQSEGIRLENNEIKIDIPKNFNLIIPRQDKPTVSNADGEKQLYFYNYYMEHKIEEYGALTGWIKSLYPLENRFLFSCPLYNDGVHCHFADAMFDDVKKSLKQRVELTGILITKKGSKFPTRMKVWEIQPRPERTDISFDKLRGIMTQCDRGNGDA